MSLSTVACVAGPKGRGEGRGGGMTFKILNTRQSKYLHCVILFNLKLFYLCQKSTFYVHNAMEFSLTDFSVSGIPYDDTY
jgi:hypothetical protein